MKEFSCHKCGSKDVFIDVRGSQKGLFCGDCGAWIKWLGKQEYALAKRYIEACNDNVNGVGGKE